MSNESTYNINIYRQAEWLLHKALRKPKWIVMLKAMVYPLINLANKFLFYRKAKLYQLMITPQVCYLEMMLNDKYDFTQRRIRIDDAVWHLPWFIYQEEELKPEFIYQESEAQPVWIYNDGEAGTALNDFVVLVPIDIVFQEPEMRSAIDAYKLFGTTYTIQRI